MQAYLSLGFGALSSSGDLFLLPLRARVLNHYHHNNQSKLNLHYRCGRRLSGGGRSTGAIFASAATNRDHQNHYAVLDISTTASSTEIKKAYRLLARKYHPDVCKDLKAGEVFKSIRLAYDVLSNEETRAQYDYELRFQEDSDEPLRRNWTYGVESEEVRRIYRWAELRRQMRREKYWQQYETDENSGESDTSEGKTSATERGSFNDVLISALFTMFFAQNIGSKLYLFFRSLFAVFDRKLDGGYKVGYLIAYVLGGRNGILLTLCLSFASWAFGKSSSSLVTLIIVATWVGANLASYVPIPQGALITLLYMSIKLQEDLK